MKIELQVMIITVIVILNVYRQLQAEAADNTYRLLTIAIADAFLQAAPFDLIEGTCGNVLSFG